MLPLKLLDPDSSVHRGRNCALKLKLSKALDWLHLEVTGIP